jgi:hypothetical protein
MEKTANAPRSLILSTRLYQALLAVYPSEFRRLRRPDAASISRLLPAGAA